MTLTELLLTLSLLSPFVIGAFLVLGRRLSGYSEKPYHDAK